MRYHRKRRIALLIGVILLFVTAAATIQIILARRDLGTEYENGINVLEHEYSAILSGYETSSRLIMDLLIADPEFTDVVAAAARARRAARAQGLPLPSGEEDLLRQRLRHFLDPLYARLEQFRFRQLHVRLPDNSSFLRMHNPGQYGDDLTGIRRTVELANREQRFVAGFEEGRVLNGYRYVEPIHTPEGFHAGTVELSISFATIVADLNEIFEKDYQFVLRRDIVESIVFPGEQIRYHRWWLSEDFLVDPDMPADVMMDRIHRSRNPTRTIGEIGRLLQTAKPFTVRFFESGTHYTITFLPIHTIEGTLAGYFSALQPNLRIGSHFRSTAILLGIYVLGAIVLIVLGILLVNRRVALEKIAALDQLTRLYNRRLFIELFEKARREQIRTKETMAVVIADLDHFKPINDTHGHNTGDQILKSVARILRKNVRAGDVVARWGGEEFLVLLRNVDLARAHEIAEKLRLLITSARPNLSTPVTASFGVVAVPPDDATLDQLVAIADTRLYEAKSAGRNRVVSG